MLTLMVQCGIVSSVEPFSGLRVRAIDRATRRYPEGAARSGATDGAGLVDGDRSAALHHVALASVLAIGR